MNTFTLAGLVEARERAGKRYHEFLHVPSMSVGTYFLAVGDIDSQEPHTEDELYYIVEGEAKLRRDDEDIAVAAGSLVFVAANVEHRFHSITRDLQVIVFFAPAEYSNRP